MLIRILLFFSSFFPLFYFLSGPALSQQLDSLELLDRMEASYSKVKDYTALFRRRERIFGELKPQEVIFLKFQKPFKVYMRWLPGPHEGREAIYVKGANRNKVLLHEASGFASSVIVSLDPDGRRVLKESRHPFTEIGIGRLIERVAQDARRAWARKELRLVDRGKDKIAGRAVHQVEGVLAQDQRAGYSAYRTILAIDEEYGLPVKALIYDWENFLVGEYTYSDVRVNPGLGEVDFKTSNSAYKFRGIRVTVDDWGGILDKK